MKRFLWVLVLAAACGRDESVAEKSAAAYREAQAKGVPVGGGPDHGHHGATPATATTATDHAAHGTMDHSAHGTGGAMDHAATGHGTSDGHAAHGAAGATDHAAMGHGATGHAAHGGVATGQHAQHGGATTAHAQHGTSATTHAQHGTSPAAADPHAQHGGAQGSGLTLPGRPEAHTTPGSPLRADPFDAAAPTAVAEAQKAAQGGGGHEGHDMRGITPGQDKENPPTPRSHATTTTTRQVVYTCPMHPEVTSTEPGTCPKCGMTLVEKK